MKEKEYNLRMLRVQKRISQMELAKMTGISRWFIQLFENGIREPSEDEMQVILIALGTTKKDKLCPHCKKVI
jgi:transcriptional regulator with XRE-family HTH domain